MLISESEYKFLTQAKKWVQEAVKTTSTPKVELVEEKGRGMLLKVSISVESQKQVLNNQEDPAVIRKLIKELIRQKKTKNFKKVDEIALFWGVEGQFGTVQNYVLNLTKRNSQMALSLAKKTNK